MRRPDDDSCLRDRAQGGTAMPTAGLALPMALPSPPDADPEDDERDRGEFNPGPWLLLGLLLWLAAAWLLLS